MLIRLWIGKLLVMIGVPGFVVDQTYDAAVTRARVRVLSPAEDRCETEDVSSWTRPGHGERLLSRATILIASPFESIRSFTVERATISGTMQRCACRGHNRLTGVR